jgi:hypothetical protein
MRGASTTMPDACSDFAVVLNAGVALGGGGGGGFFEATRVVDAPKVELFNMSVTDPFFSVNSSE